MFERSQDVTRIEGFEQNVRLARRTSGGGPAVQSEVVVWNNRAVLPARYPAAFLIPFNAFHRSGSMRYGAKWLLGFWWEWSCTIAPFAAQKLIHLLIRGLVKRIVNVDTWRL